jgi:hypothetical protein
VLTAAVGIDARLKGDVRTGVVGYEALGRVLENLCLRLGKLGRIDIRIGLDLDQIKAVGRVRCGASAFHLT